MNKKTVSLLFSYIFFLLTLAGCASSGTTEQVVVEEPTEIIEEDIKSVDVPFAQKDFAIPYDFALFHTAVGMYPVSVDVDELYFTLKGEKEDVCMLRSAHLTSNVTNVNDADAVIKSYCDASYYNSSEIVYGKTDLYESFYVQPSITTTLEDKTNSIFTLIPKNSNEIYSVTFMSDKNGNPLCAVDDTKIVLNSLQKYSGVPLEENFFYRIFRQFLDNQARELVKYKQYAAIPVLADEASCDLEAETTYYLGLDTGLYTIETLEGEGEVLVEDSRFGTRVLLLGYDSANAPIHLPDVTLVHGGGIKTNMGLRIRIVK